MIPTPTLTIKDGGITPTSHGKTKARVALDKEEISKSNTQIGDSKAKGLGNHSHMSLQVEVERKPGGDCRKLRQPITNQFQESRSCNQESGEPDWPNG